MSLDADLRHLTDAVASCRFARMALQAEALRKQDRRPEEARTLMIGSSAAGDLADEYAAVALFHYVSRDARSA